MAARSRREGTRADDQYTPALLLPDVGGVSTALAGSEVVAAVKAAKMRGISSSGGVSVGVSVGPSVGGVVGRSVGISPSVALLMMFLTNSSTRLQKPPSSSSIASRTTSKS